MDLHLYLTSTYGVSCPRAQGALQASSTRLTREGMACTRTGALPGSGNGPRGEAMVPELLRRLAGRSASTSADDETRAGGVQALERRCRSGQMGNRLPSDWVRMYVWRRDHGRCVRCGGQERVWFEYIVPVRAGGSNTEQNIRLMCGRCSQDARKSVRRKWRRA